MANRTARLTSPNLQTPIEQLTAVPRTLVEPLRRLELFRAKDILFDFPRSHFDVSDRRTLATLEEGKLQTVLGTIESWESRTTRRGTLMTANIFCGTGYIRGLWFNQTIVARIHPSGSRVFVTGKPKDDPPYWSMMHPMLTPATDTDDALADPLLPHYNLTKGLRDEQLRRIVKKILPEHTPLVTEVFPQSLREKYGILGIQDAIPAMHFPRTHEELRLARRRFVYQELFVLQLALATRRLQLRTHLRGPQLVRKHDVDLRIRKLFPFDFTHAQNKVIEEIVRDMAEPFPMNRLLQGDVGSGKTVVAVYAMLLAVACGYQAVFMAPTEVLARQHLRTLTRLLDGSSVTIAPLFGSQTTSERASVLQSILAGESKVIVGTHAIISGDLPLDKLGVVVIDEQHKFGVRQRAALKQAAGGTDPHYLVMTATPIPRSIAMTLFGDLDVSVMDEKPRGGQTIHTYVTPEEKRAAWWEFVRKKLDTGQQGYVVVPMIEESDAFDARSLEEVTRTLREHELRGYNVGTLHGRMTTAEKEQQMASFRNREIQVLVATTVIEVGVDVPNANVMTIESGERFGLSQLHQLRGRIGRGKHPGFCAVFVTPSDDADAYREALARLEAFAATNDGFALAEKDLAFRGSGNILGTAQHGLPPFHIADLHHDRETLIEARRDAQALVAADPGLANPDHALLRSQMLTRYGQVLNLGDVG
ncbi:MAG: ATP-dependent DNA helicase RecG [Thermoguttaceae bacterium]